MKRYFFFLLILFFSIQIFSQNIVQTLRGNITDKDNKSPLIGASIILQNTLPLIGTTSDLDGNFIIKNVPVGRYSIKIWSMGFKPLILENVDINSGKELVLNCSLEESVNQLNTVIITASNNKLMGQNDMNTISSRTFSVEETGRYAGSRNDVSRMASNYAGVNSGNDSRNDIIIRGNSPTGLLWRMEGLDIPGPNHFSGVGSNGGSISMLNYNVIANSDFITSAFPAEFGNALSGVFDIELRNGNNEKHEQMFQFGALGTEFMLEGPFNKSYKGSYLVNYRFSTTSILTRMGIDFGFNGEADYQDISYKFALPAGKLGTFELFGLAGKSIYKLPLEKKEEDSFDYNLTDNTNNAYETKLGVFGISHLIRITDNTYIKTVAGFTANEENGKVDSVSTFNAEIVPYYSVTNTDNKYSIHTFLKSKINAHHNIKTGIILDNKLFDINEKMYNQQLGTTIPYRTANYNTALMQTYAQWKYLFTDELSLLSGLHYQHFFLNNANSLEPRLGLNWAFTNKQTISLGYGWHSQMQILPVYFVNTITENDIANTNKSLGFNKSKHYVLGYTNMLFPKTALKIETYYQDLYNIPVTKSSQPSSFSLINEGGDWRFSDRDSLINKGTGSNIGLELTVEKFLHKGYYFLLTASIFDSKYKGSDNIERNTAFNGNDVINFLAGKEFKITDFQKILIDVKVVTAGGRRYTPIMEEPSRLAGVAVYDVNNAYSKQHSRYFRSDLKVTYRVNAKKVSHEFFINIDNVFNNQNIYGQVYSKKNNSLQYVYQLGIFPTFQYKIMF